MSAGTLPLVCVFAKPPRPGAVKTRLAATLGPAAAAELAQAFLEDTCEALRGLPLAAVLATTEPWCAAPLGSEVWLQGEGSLGERLERTLRRALGRSGCAIALGADSPGFPAHALVEAARRLEVVDVVFGPADDGGFWFVALRACPAGLFDGVPWSTAEALCAAERRAAACGLASARGRPWFDIDTARDLHRLCALLDRGRAVAPATARVLRSLSARERAAAEAHEAE